ncbi:SDR family oxidoreductase [Streptomyces vinaceus]|uniref:SDR family oxidoreductase n=1 Tax=Streptomyces vinaceus TaxID=1960 RepID=UPI0036B62B9C
MTGDVADPRANRAMVDAAVEAYGRLDVAVANAGVLPLSDVNETSPEDWDHVMAVDGRGMFLTCTYAIEAMTAQERPGRPGAPPTPKAVGDHGPAKFVASGLTEHLAGSGSTRWHPAPSVRSGCSR